MATKVRLSQVERFIINYIFTSKDAMLDLEDLFEKIGGSEEDFEIALGELLSWGFISIQNAGGEMIASLEDPTPPPETCIVIETQAEMPIPHIGKMGHC